MKIRIDFVSNSSSSSFIVSTKTNTKIETIAKKLASDSSTEKKYLNYLTNNIALTLFPLDYLVNPRTKKAHLENVYGFFCISKKKIFTYFNKDGTVKNDLNINNLLKSSLSSQSYPDSSLAKRKILCGKVTSETIKFCKWIYTKLVQKRNTSAWALKGEYNRQIKYIENELKNGKEIYIVVLATSGELKGDVIEIPHDCENWFKVLTDAGFKHCYAQEWN